MVTLDQRGEIKPPIDRQLAAVESSHEGKKEEKDLKTGDKLDKGI